MTAVDISRVLRAGRTLRGRCYELRWLQTGAASAVALVMGRRVGSAVVRNTMKRIAREWFRATRERLPSGQYVIRGLPGQSGTRETWWDDLRTIERRVLRK